MGCVCSSSRKATRKSPPSFCEETDGLACVRKSSSKILDSGELQRTPARAAGGKVPETSSILGRASIASLERAVEVLDTLGSSMSNLNPTNGFVSGVAVRENKISILAFEVANTIAKGANLLRSLSDNNIQYLKEEILQSDGVKQLVSVDTRELMSIAATDKREELEIFSREVVRFGDLCKDPVWHNLGRYFDKLDTHLTPQEQLNEESETIMEQLMNLAKNTSELYHELHALDRLDQDYRRKLKEEESLPAARRESLMILRSEIKRQGKLVKILKKKSLWSRNLEEVVEKLVDIVVFLHKQILEAFSMTGTDLFDYEHAREQRLGASGLALHYANIISKIDSIVSRPLSLPPNIRETLYHGLPASVKAALRSRLQSTDSDEEYTVGQIKAEMERTLRWIVPIAENTIKAHQGFGWVGEWANICTEVSRKQATQPSIARIETLHHAAKGKVDECILELVVWLHHLVIQVKNRGYGFKALNPIRTRPHKGTQETKHCLSPSSVSAITLSEEEREMLDCVSSKRIVLERSRSLEVVNRRENRRERSRSCGDSPNKALFICERTKVLDIIDGLDTGDMVSI